MLPLPPAALDPGWCNHLRLGRTITCGWTPTTTRSTPARSVHAKEHDQVPERSRLGTTSLR